MDWSVPLSNLTSFSTIQQLRTLLAQFSIPQTVVSDNGACFTNEEFREFMDKNGIHHVLHLLSSIQWTCRTCCMKDLKKTIWRHNLWKDSLFSVLLRKHSTQHYWGHQLIWCLTVAFMIGLLNPSLESCLEHNQQKVMISMLMNSSLVFLCLILVKKQRGYLASFLKWQDLSYTIELINNWIVRRHQDHIRMHHNTLLTPLLVPEQV